MHHLNRVVRLSPEVYKAMTRAKGDIFNAKIVLLESAILTHGMPYPKNYEMSLEVQQIIRDRVRKYLGSASTMMITFLLGRDSCNHWHSGRSDTHWNG
jgi:pseudouridine-5'-phosphate glycosidase